MDNLVTLWRPTAFFLGTIVPDEKVMDAIRSHNAPTAAGAGEAFRPQNLVEAGCLNIVDLREFGAWLVQEPAPTTYVAIKGKLMELQKRRLLRWHLDVAPPDKVDDSLRMFHAAGAASPPLMRSPSVWWEGVPLCPHVRRYRSPPFP
jgi:hypothetical protein